MPRWWSIALLAGLGALAAAVFALWPSARGGHADHRAGATTLAAGGGRRPPSTRVEFFEPYDGRRLAAGVRLLGVKNGRCFSGSIAVADPHAWRCISRNAILDPCFAPPGQPRPSSVVCGTPWSGLTRLELESPLPRASADRRQPPSVGWLLQLANGARCQLSQGAAGVERRVAVVYSCGAGAVAGALRWSEEPWTVRYLARGATAARKVAVEVAWGG